MKRLLVLLLLVGVVGCGESEQVAQQPTAEKRIVNSIGMKLTLIPAGEFQMGTPYRTRITHFRVIEEQPQHLVKITRPFYLAVHEVTQQQYEKVMGARPWQGGFGYRVKEGPDYPASCVSHDDAVEFCRRLSKQEGVEYRLPTEAEWEYACRAGTTTAYSFGDDEAKLGQYAWYSKNAVDIGEEYAHRVGQKLPNPWDLYDMHGNVREWCGDWYARYGSDMAVSDPMGPTQGNTRLTRSGSFSHSPTHVRSAYRYDQQPDVGIWNYGFRVARSPEPPRAQNESPEPPLVETDADKAKREYEKGVDFAAHEDWAAAITDYTEAIRIKPDFAKAYNNRGEAYFNRESAYFDLEEYDKAIADYTEAIRIKPDFAKAYYNRGLAYRKKGELDKAITDYTEAIRINPDYAEAYYNRGLAYRKKGELDKAITDYTEVIRIDPGYADAYNNRGWAYIGLEEYDKAIADYTEAIRINPDDADAYNNRGNAYDELGQYDKAIVDYTHAIQIDPRRTAGDHGRGIAKAYYSRGYSYSYLKEYDKAITDYTHAIRIDPGYADAYNNRGYAYGELGQYDKAIVDFTEAIRIDPDYAKAYYGRGVAYQELGEKAKADADFAKAKELGYKP